MKLVVNLLLGINMEAIAEAVSFGENLNLNREVLLDVLPKTVVIAPAFSGKFSKIKTGDYSPQFPILNSNTVEPIEALPYCLNLPIAVQITGIDSQQILDQALEATRTYKSLSQAEVASLLDRTRPAAFEGKYEPYKTSAHFDGTAHKPELLG